MRSYHKTIQIRLNDSQGDRITPEEMDELIDVTVGLLGVHFPPLALSSVAVYKLPNYTTGRIDYMMTIVAQGED